MRVLIGVDGSAASLAAVRFVSRVLSPKDAEIVFYYSPPAIAVRGRADAETVQRAEEALATAVFQRSRSELPTELQSKVENRRGTQKASHGILLAAEECRADLIAVGARGAGLVERWILGSVSRTVAQGANVPVLVVHDKPRTPPTDDFRVLVACDRSESCRRCQARTSSADVARADTRRSAHRF